MLKKCYTLFLGLMVIAGSACVTPTHASSAFIVITNIRAGGQNSATEEGIVIYNNSSVEVDITNWCFTNKSSIKFACITPENQGKIFLPGYSYGTIVSLEAQINPDTAFYTSLYQQTNRTSGAIIASSDTISLLDTNGEMVDSYTWSSGIGATQQWSRMKSPSAADVYVDTNSASDWQKTTYDSFPVSQTDYRATEQPPGGPDEPTEPTEPVDPASPPAKLFPAIITELLPNAVGSDTGNEYIEIFNPNAEEGISLKGYTLSIGPSLEKVLILGEYSLLPGEYKIFTNAELGYTLLNTSSKVMLKTNTGVISTEVPAYTSPPEGESWAHINGVWQYTNQPTPAAENRISSVDDDDSNPVKTALTIVPKPCAANQYRSTETNRCRLIAATQAAVQTPCKVGQQRNLETNRCRNNTTSSTSTECKEGQEKNPETNRCRTIKQLAPAGFGVKGATEKQGDVGWYVLVAIVGIALLVVGYAAWEWRVELKQLFKTLKAKFAAKRN